MEIRGTRGKTPPIRAGLRGSLEHFQSLDNGMRSHRAGPLPMAGTGPTERGGGRNRVDGGQDNNPNRNASTDGNSEVLSSDGPFNSGPRSTDGTTPTSSMFPSLINNNAAPDTKSILDFLGGGPRICPTKQS